MTTWTPYPWGWFPLAAPGFAELTEYYETEVIMYLKNMKNTGLIFKIKLPMATVQI